MATQERKEVKAVVLLWDATSKKGEKYFESKYYKAFYNTNKKNPNEPDLRIFKIQEDGTLRKEEYASLWCNVSKKENKYLSGKRYDGVGLVGFIHKTKKTDKSPAISIYIQAEYDASKPEVKEDLPF